jgi:hypothetical protein
VTIDISALAAMVRRMDVSATLKSFVVVVAVLLVWTNLVTIGEMLRSGMLEIVDDPGFLAAWIGTAAVAAVGPLAFVLWDWVARRPWRHLAAITGAAIGGIGFAAVGGVLDILCYSMTEQVDTEISPEWLVLTGLIGVIGWLLAMARRRPGFARRLSTLAAAVLLAAIFVVLLRRTIDVSQTTWREQLGLVGVLAAVPVAAWLFTRAVRHRIVLSGDHPRELMLGAIHRKGFWARLAFLAGLPSSLWHVRAMTRPAFWAFLVARPLVYAGVLVLLGNADLGVGPVATAGVGAGAIIGGHALFLLGKRLAARYIWDPEHPDDPRPPILFLRSFEDDQLRFRRPAWDLAGRWLDLWSFRRNIDEALIDEIAQYGPVVALGMPGETRVPFGAMRYYSKHEDWQRIVTETAQRAQAIVIGAGSTPGVLWEYGLLAREKLVDRSLLLFPPTGSGGDASAAALRAFAQATGTATGQSTVDDDGRLIALLTADAGPTLLQAREPDAAAYLVAVRAHFQRTTATQLADPLRV